jgi:hypothetical protein
VEVKLAALANAATDTAAGTVQPAISPEMSMKDVRGLARKRAEPAEGPVLERVAALAGEPGVPILAKARPGDVLADLTPLVLVGG